MTAWGRVVGAVLLLGTTAACAQPAESLDDESVTAGTSLPPAGAQFDYQLGGDSPIPAGVDMVVRQSEDGSAAPGIYSVCYINAFQTEADPDGPGGADAWPDGLVLDDEDPEWPGEHPIDISTETHRTEATAFVAQSFNRCAENGFAAVELDNLDSYERYADPPFDRDDTIAYARMLVEEANRAGLAVGQKNAADLLDAGRSRIGFDFAIVEQCGEYDECEPFVDTFGGAVFDVEYDSDGLATACRTIGDRASVILRDVDLVPQGDPGYVYRTC